MIHRSLPCESGYASIRFSFAERNYEKVWKKRGFLQNNLQSPSACGIMYFAIKRKEVNK